MAQMRLEAGTGMAFVGDDINDSPALAMADAGIALSSGSDIPLESASIVLIRNTLLDVPAALFLLRRIFLQIQLNFAWATCYYLVVLPLAMGVGLLWGWCMRPMMVVAAMTASSVSVACGSLTLEWWKRPAHLSGISISIGAADANIDAEALEQMSEPKALSLLSGLHAIMPSLPNTRSKRTAVGYEALPPDRGDAIEML